MEEKEKKPWENTKFTERVRIRKNQLDYIDKIRGNYTKAGKLDEIINFYKKHNKI